MKYSQDFTMQELFTNKKLDKVFPQFKQGKLQNVYSFRDTEERVLQFLKGLLNGRVVNESDLQVKGQHRDVLRRVKASKWLIEDIINNTPAIVKNIRKNAKLYLPYATIDSISGITDYDKKMQALKEVMDNLNYNPDMQGNTRLKSNVPMSYLKRQEAWKKKVGYKE